MEVGGGVAASMQGYVRLTDAELDVATEGEKGGLADDVSFFQVSMLEHPVIPELEIEPENEAGESGDKEESGEGLAGAGAIHALGLPAGPVERAAGVVLCFFGGDQVAVPQTGAGLPDRGSDYTGFQFVDLCFDVILLVTHLADAVLEFGMLGLGGAADCSFGSHIRVLI